MPKISIINTPGATYDVNDGSITIGRAPECELQIAQNSVSVKLGNNTYKAGIGEILTEGAINHNDVANLNKKFGGER